MPKKRTRKQKSKRRVRSPAPTMPQPMSGELVTTTRTPEERLTAWFDLKLSQLRDRVDRLESASVGEFADLIDKVREQVRGMETKEFARVAEINRLGRAASDAARSRVDDVVHTAAGQFVSHEYLHTWVSRVQQELADLRALLEKQSSSLV